MGVFFNKIRVVAIGVLLFCLPVFVWAQFDAQMTQYMFNVEGYNPAAIGDQELLRVVGMQRLQWIGLRNAPKTTDFTFSAPFKIKRTSHAVGVHFQNDMFGLFVNQRLGFTYAYKQRLGDGFLSIGTSVGFANMTISGDSAYIPEGGEYYTGVAGDSEIPKSKESDMGFDMDLGAYYSCANFDVGFSVLHVTQPRIMWGESSEFFLTRTYLLQGGYKFRLPNPDYSLRPSLLVKTDFVSWQLDLSLLAEWKEKVWWGVSYRVQDAVAFLVGTRVLNGLMIGYSYDLSTSRLLRVSYGSHELFLSYEFKLNMDRRSSRHKSVRFL